MQRESGPEKTTWSPPMWAIRLVVILLVAWYVSRQIPPEKQRGAAPAPEQNATFEPAIPVSEKSPDIASKDSTVELETRDKPAVAESVKPAVPEFKPAPPVESLESSSTSPKPATNTKSPVAKESTTKPKTPAADPLIIPNITIKDQSGRVVFKGEIDLHPTFDRIERGEKFPHRNDGSTFRNLEGRLPKKQAGYYTEYVHPTKGINGPGPQRIVIGKNGEAFYTHDHYDTFRKVRE